MAAEIGLRNGGIAPYFFRRAFRDLAPEVHNVNPVGNVHHDPHLVFDHQHRNAQLVTNIEHEPGDVLGLLLIHARHHFIEQQQLRFAGQRAREFDALLLTVRQRSDDGIADVLDLEEFNDLLDPPASVDLLGSGAAEEQHGVKDA